MINECLLSGRRFGWNEAHRFQRGLHESMLQAVEERLSIPFVYLAYEHATDALDGLFTDSPIMLRFLALQCTEHR